MFVFDVDANFGYHTLGMSRKVSDEGRVLTIEPTSRAFQRLLRNE